MRIVANANNDIVKIWKVKSISNTEYRLIDFVLRFNSNDNCVLYHTVTGEMVELDHDEYQTIASLPSRYSDGMDELIRKHFLVPVSYDEHNAIIQLRKIFNLFQKERNAINKYIVMPTSYCNARCFYCFENDYKHVHMSQSTANKLVDYMIENAKGFPIHLSWFGGEPLIGEEIIDVVSDKLEQNGVQFKANMISNGYLFTKDLIEKAVKKWHLYRIQITLDGTEDVYNKTKAYISPRENPFLKVLHNIELLLSSGIKVEIRLNVGKYNIEDIKQLISELLEKFASHSNLVIYCRKLYENKGYNPEHNTPADELQLDKTVVEFNEYVNNHFTNKCSFDLPTLRGNQCMADNNSTLFVDPEGNFYKCEHICDSEMIGSIDNGIVNTDTIESWKKTITYPTCKHCPLYPGCVMLDKCEDKAFCHDFVRDSRVKNCVNHVELYYKHLNKSHAEVDFY